MKYCTLLLLATLLLGGCGMFKASYWPSTACPQHNTQDADDVCLITHPYQDQSAESRLRVFTSTVSGDGRLAAVAGVGPDGGKPSPVLLVDMASGGLTEYESPGGVNAAALSPDGTWLAAGTNKGEQYVVRVWRLGSPGNMRDLTAPTVHTTDSEAFYTSVAFTPDSRTIIAGRDTGDIVLWDAATGTVERIITPLKWNQGASRLSVSADGTKLATAGVTTGPYVVIYDLRTGAILDSLDVSTLDRQQSWPQGVTFSPDASTVAITANCRDLDCGGAVWLWDLNTGQTRALHGHVNDSLSVVFHPDGRWLASGGLDNTIRLWDWRAGREIYRMSAPAAHEVITGTPAPGVPAGAGGLGSSTQGLWSPVNLLSITAKGDLLVFSEPANGQARAWRLPERLWK
ncbi:MAG TPA: WD40 repeat domain-containing protein [Roseiflexaceae bacterium]|nr:WD40 repeat domain-containing protein [Roseiflexaceae bacterium]